MPPRLSETYPLGAAVEIALSLHGEEQWLPGRVAAHQHPGVWVVTADGRAWFVTNGKRIRPLARPSDDARGQPAD
ncbi:MAG: hypothetical protein RMN53_14955 [Anaerolineae bacterium]|nr:hypothetical protein [Anaerolineae bacterium]